MLLFSDYHPCFCAKITVAETPGYMVVTRRGNLNVGPLAAGFLLQPIDPNGVVVKKLALVRERQIGGSKPKSIINGIK